MDRRASEGIEEVVELTEFHFRCLEKRVGECNDALMQAVAATCSAETEEPGNEAIHALHAVLRAAQKLTATAFEVSGRCHVDTAPRSANLVSPSRTCRGGCLTCQAQKPCPACRAHVCQRLETCKRG